MAKLHISYRVGTHANTRLIVQTDLLVPYPDALHPWLEQGSLYATAHCKKRLIGLAILHIDPWYKACEVGVYVNHAFRRCGVGTALVQKLLARTPQSCSGTIVYAPGAEKFFDPILVAFELQGKLASWFERVSLFDRH